MKPTAPALTLLFLSNLLNGADRVAFVLGVDTYENFPAERQLNVAVSDARRMASTLESVDPPFKVTLVTDAGWRDSQTAFSRFLDEARDAECALVYFAGHGVEYYGTNFLIVKDTDIAHASPDVERMKRDLAAQAVSLQSWVDSLERTRAKVKVVVLDCCRDNPLKVEDDAGQQANDGLFTEVLTANLKAPGLNILKVFAKTRQEVREISTAWADEDVKAGKSPDRRRTRHEPAEYNKLDLAGTDFAFTRGVPVAVKAADSVSSAEMAKMKAELAAALGKLAAADGNAAEMAKLQKELAEARTKMAEAVPASALPSVPSSPITPIPMARPTPATTPAFPAAGRSKASETPDRRLRGGHRVPSPSSATHRPPPKSSKPLRERL